MLAAACVVYVQRRADRAATRALAVACTVCMVLAPNIVWLHHVVLLIPGLWILLVEAKSRALFLIAVAALLCLQSLRCLQFELGVAPAIPSAVGQLILIAGSVLYTTFVIRMPAIRA
jgi:uncharacterized membrane protein